MSSKKDDLNTLQETSIRLLKFNGNPKDYHEWATKFMEIARERWYKKVLTGEEKAPDDAIEDEKLTDKEKRKRDANNTAFTQLLMSCGKTAFDFIENAMTTSLPEGDAGLAWSRLKNKYAPSNKKNKMKKLAEFSACLMEHPTEDPDLWFE